MIILRQKKFSGHSISWQHGLDATRPGIIVDNGKKLDPKGNWDDEYLSDSFHIKLNQEMRKREEKWFGDCSFSFIPIVLFYPLSQRS